MGARDLEAAYGDMVLEISERPPAHLRFGGSEELALRIRQADVVQGQLAEQGAFDLADMNSKHARRLQLVVLPDDEAAAHLAVEPEEEQDDEQDDRKQGDAGPFRG